MQVSLLPIGIHGIQTSTFTPRDCECRPERRGRARGPSVVAGLASSITGAYRAFGVTATGAVALRLRSDRPTGGSSGSDRLGVLGVGGPRGSSGSDRFRIFSTGSSGSDRFAVLGVRAI